MNNLTKLTLTILALTTAVLFAENPTSKLAQLPPMGWNSYDAFGSSVTEDEILANARYMKEKRLSHGWNYVVIDFRWSDPDAAKYAPSGIGGPLIMDQFGRLVPATNRFPSATGGNGFKPLAAQLHAMGLKFGIHVMRGIPRQAVDKNTPIEGSDYHAADAANIDSTCKWCKDMWGMDASKPAGQAYYDSLFRLYASWDVDYVKVDDLSLPYSALEIDAVRKAIDKCGRPMVFSTSPGETPVDQAKDIAAKANMWRVSRDFWDKWKSLDHAFDLAAKWQDVGGPGHWPDYDMIPFGRIGIRCVGKDRQTNFSHDEQLTLMSLWAIGPSPLMLGGSLTDNDEWALSVITNDEVLSVNQDKLGKPGSRVSQSNKLEVWSRDLAEGSKAVGLFNRGDTDAQVSVTWKELKLSGPQTVRDIWQHKDLGKQVDGFSAEIPSHGCILLKVSPAK